MKWPALANGWGAFINLLKVRQLNESGHRLGRLTVREWKGLRGEERTIQAGKECVRTHKNSTTHNHPQPHRGTDSVQQITFNCRARMKQQKQDYSSAS